MTEAARYSMSEIFSALHRHAKLRADWLDTLDRRDPVRIMSEMANAASIYVSQPFEHNRVTLEGVIKKAQEIEKALLAENIEVSAHLSQQSENE
jgi:hypothetical protein